MTTKHKHETHAHAQHDQEVAEKVEAVATPAAPSPVVWDGRDAEVIAFARAVLEGSPAAKEQAATLLKKLGAKV